MRRWKTRKGVKKPREEGKMRKESSLLRLAFMLSKAKRRKEQGEKEEIGRTSIVHQRAVFNRGSMAILRRNTVVYSYTKVSDLNITMGQAKDLNFRGRTINTRSNFFSFVLHATKTVPLISLYFERKQRRKRK